ncbi:hypothetical protein F0P96_01210 [Hymenobacter busanensis]|uniref:Uncharacterized protein n=1 Tax=Hymenobacter busanensis TaxID=2607656 RepID=A0A7L4ZVV4_9BACT|nr:hypothetical protein [Hymenobacter busanensis]KAA9339273.1 hypothetical protein F0P96_01210 [Hymenobacter busanensis]QHJ06965.1 hypothetical protein GUY19_06540 [Hymenobacter busanensis]
MGKQHQSRKAATKPAPPVAQPNALFKARLLGYLVGIVPLLALLLLFRQVLPSTVALVLVMLGTFASVVVQQRVRLRFPYDFKRREEWWALGAYTLVVLVVTVAFFALQR